MCVCVCVCVSVCVCKLSINNPVFRAFQHYMACPHIWY